MKLKKKYTLSELASKYECDYQGNEDTIIESISSITNPDENSIVFLIDKKKSSFVENEKICCLLTTSSFSSLTDKPSILSDNPLFVFSSILTDNHSYKFDDGEIIDTKKYTNFADSAYISKKSFISKNVEIGENTIIYPGVSIYDNVKIGDNVIIHSGAVIGSDGFGLVKDNTGTWTKIPQIGSVFVGNNVEIGANTTIDRGSIDSTIIEQNVKIDNLVHIAHNVHIKENTAIAACVGVAGSTIIGKDCTIGGGSGINGHIEIGDNIHIHGMAMVTKTLTEPGHYASGTTIETAETWRKNQARFKMLDTTLKKLTRDIGE